VLDPRDRVLLRDALRPPEGFEFDGAVLTTFSLDLVTLLAVPLAFASFGLREDSGSMRADPMALLEALRRYADRTTVFCQAGRIQVPKSARPLLSQLEGSVVEVTSPHPGGVFHPKVGVLRYRAAAGPGQGGSAEVRYRLLCSSRNLTFDRSWDTLLVLEGELTGRRNALAMNRPLSAFVEALPARAVSPPYPGHVETVRTMADELLRVRFELPEGFEEMEFCPIGLGGQTFDRPWRECDRLLVVSPFVTDDFVDGSAGVSGERWLISRKEALDGLVEDPCGTFDRVHYLDPHAEPSVGEMEGDEGNELEEPATPASASGVEAIESDGVKLEPSAQLGGLHAKLFVAEAGWHADVWSGSANATKAAFERNVEFLVRLRGKKSNVGIDTFLPRGAPAGSSASKKKSSVTFTDLLVSYERSEVPAQDQTLIDLEKDVDQARIALATAGLRAQVDGGPDAYGVCITLPPGRTLILPGRVRVECTPVTVRGGYRPLTMPVSGEVVAFGPVSFVGLTTFFAFRLSARDGKSEQRCAFVLNLPTTGMPEDRAGRLLVSMLKDRRQLLRYLLFLLANDEDAAERAAESLTSSELTTAAAAGGDVPLEGLGLPLLEPMMRALDRHPESLRRMAKVIDDLRKTPSGSNLVSEEFLSVFKPIITAVGKGGSS
jgi:hypothetical protein